MTSTKADFDGWGMQVASVHGQMLKQLNWRSDIARTGNHVVICITTYTRTWLPTLQLFSDAKSSFPPIENAFTADDNKKGRHDD